jgi:ATP-dependent helicase HepA
MAIKFTKGQRWISETEPELGLGIIAAVDGRFVDVHFPGRQTSRRYSAAAAPLRRIKYKPGDMVRDCNGKRHTIGSVEEDRGGGLIVYRCGDGLVREEEIDGASGAGSPLDRLYHGIIDSTESFDLRAEMLDAKAELQRSPLRGFSGCRIELLPHQLSIADTVASRGRMRALLADETGLGKTIEACLIVHRLLTIERIGRVLVIVPEHLVHQWFVELLRRFNLTFRLFTKEYFSAFTNANPFAADQLGICTFDLLLGDAQTMRSVIDAGWDLCIVDEAHHLKKGSPEFSLVEQLARSDGGLLFLTATPEQLGSDNHFALLHLLDPLRYADREEYRREAAALRKSYQFVEDTLQRKGIDLTMTAPADVEVDVPPDLLPNDAAAPDNTPSVRMSLEQFLDLQGTGSVTFRNTRRTISGFPAREVHLAPLAIPVKHQERILGEIRHDLLLPGALSSGSIAPDDPRVALVVRLLTELPDVKFIVICTTKDKAENLCASVQTHCKVATALFHEEMTILQRDRNAAWFSEENGARLLISSEIGSEGRNFQFCQHLILFDLPLNPEILEQRIGRLDRIGQRATIHLHVPYFTGTPQETVCRWYHEGLDAFSRHAPAASGVFEQQRESLIRLCAAPADPGRVDKFIEQTGDLCRQLTQEHYEARDSLFDLLSYQPARARALVAAIIEADRSGSTERIMRRLFNHYGIATDEAGNKKLALITDYVNHEGFPLPRNERPVITYDRTTALAREDVEFLTLDHPMVAGAIELFCGSEQGTTSLAKWPGAQENGILLEAVYLVECVAPAALTADRFFPPSPLRIVIDNRKTEVTERFTAAAIRAHCVNDTLDRLPVGLDTLQSVLTPMVEAGGAAAERRLAPLVADAVAKMKSFYEGRINRLRYCNGAKESAAETARLSDECRTLEKHLRTPQVRLDMARIILRIGTKAK